jgi:pyridoxal phosphate enzyme (YggS family)
MSSIEPPNIAANLTFVRERLARAAERAGRRHDDITLIAVTKTVEAARVQEAAAAGLTDFGENYVQEARAKIPKIAADADKISWHFIGHLQSNKAKYSVELFSLIHSVDNYQLAQEIDKHASKRGKTQAVLLEVNLAGNPERAGVEPEALAPLVEKVTALPGIHLQGLMGMAPLTGEAEGARPHFARLRRLWESLPEENRRILSMGMSGDFETAVEEGATHVRIGTALFGRRQQT